MPLVSNSRSLLLCRSLRHFFLVRTLLIFSDHRSEPQSIVPITLAPRICTSSTPLTTEAASIGALGSFLYILLRGRLTWKNLISTIRDTGVTATMMITILIGAMCFSIFLSITGIPMLAADWITSLQVNRYVVLGTVLLIYIPLGCVMDSMAMIVLTIPLFFPTLEALGFSPILLGILASKSIEIGQITPPVGPSMSVTKTHPPG